jgi:phosphate transport system substrate-binding protein
MKIIGNAYGRRLLAAALLLGIIAVATARADTLKIAGTGAGLGTMRSLGAEFSKATGVTVVVVPNLGTSGALKALAEGAVDMAVTARPLTAEETKKGMVAVEYGRTPFVIATRKKGAPPAKNLSELVEIYAGRRTAWPDGEPIRLVLRPQYDIDIALLSSFSPEMKLAVQAAMAKPGMIVASTDQDSADALEHTPGALGTASLALIFSEKRDLHVLSLNGVTPTPKTVADGTYPYFKTMYLVRKTGGKEPAPRFFEFLSSAQARQILIDSGHWLTDPRTGR